MTKEEYNKYCKEEDWVPGWEPIEQEIPYLFEKNLNNRIYKHLDRVLTFLRK